MQWIFDLKALIASDSQLTASIFSLVCRGSRDWHRGCLVHLIAAPSLLFEWTISATHSYIYRTGGHVQQRQIPTKENIVLSDKATREVLLLFEQISFYLYTFHL